MCHCSHYEIQKIVYAKGSSDVIAKLRGTYNVPTAGPTAGAGLATDLQRSIFGAPPSAVATTGKPSADVGKEEESRGAQGVKRPREEESDEGEAPMDEEDSDVPMEASSDED
jgi:U2 small nuclear ribonucleoprotein B''